MRSLGSSIKSKRLAKARGMKHIYMPIDCEDAAVVTTPSGKTFLSMLLSDDQLVNLKKQTISIIERAADMEDHMKDGDVPRHTFLGRKAFE